LPFGALQDNDGKWLLEKKTLLELAKPTDFMKIAYSKAIPVTKVVAFANATLDLPSAEQEGQNILAIFPDSTLFKRGEASKKNLMEFGSQAQVLHLATHGTWDASNSLNNHLKLSNNETLAQEEIFNLDLEGTSLVTLSACNTARADETDVDYVASLAEAFWIAGSNTVVASLWPVDDVSTGQLMTKFYERLKAGDGRAEALRNAQLAVQQDPRFSHPYYWSGFLLFGDYR
jgi:CHAT domain-containing protein